MQITRYPSLTGTQFLGCVRAFVDSLFGELNSAVMFVRKLEGRSKGSAFAFEMSLDTHRYGALIVLERWASLLEAFGPHVTLDRHPQIVSEGPARIRTAEDILEKANRLLDAAPAYTPDLVAACVAGFQALTLTFEEERAAAAELSSTPQPEFEEARRIFLADLAVR